MSDELRAVPVILKWLNERTIAEIALLLDGWTKHVDMIPVKLQEIWLLTRGGVAFGVVADARDHGFRTLLHAMALAIAAGEMDPAAALKNTPADAEAAAAAAAAKTG